jgi:pyridoxal 5'-phosphate synthase pdxT subunit
MKVGVLALQGDVREHVAVLERIGVSVLPVKTTEDLQTVDALVLPGGESTTIGKLLARYGLLDPLSERARSGMPLFGTCAGMILMAADVAGDQDAPHRLGLLDITVRRNAYGRQRESFEAELDVAGVDSSVRAAFIRAPVVERAGEDVEVLARHEDRPALVRQGTLWASSFHPEITGEGRIHELFVAGAQAR